MIDTVNPYEEIYNKIIEDCKKTGVATLFLWLEIKLIQMNTQKIES